MKNERVKRIQEWLCLRGLYVAVDGEFGPATEATVKVFQAREGVPQTGIVNEDCFSRLVAPMRAALVSLAPDGRTLGDMIVAVAMQHLSQAPREMGGQNCGPWVRLYMDGHEGAKWPWCAGFATFCLQRATSALGQQMPVARTYSCDTLAALAQASHRFLGEPTTARQRTRVTPGSLFLRRRTANDWKHTGIVVSSADEVFRTIEGNTNDEGSAEGYEVCARTRGYNGMDFVLFDSTEPTGIM